MLRDYAAGFYLSEAQNPKPPNTLYTCIHCILIRTGKGGGDLKRRGDYRGNSSQSWVENTNMTDCIFSL